MNPSEAWALLTIRSKHFGRQPAGHGATTTFDIAGLLAGLDREPFLMGMAAELGDLGALKQIELVLWERARHIGERENWDPPRGQFTVRRMVAVALFEAIDDRRCYVCNGSGEMAFTIKEIPGMVMAPTFRAISPIAGTVRCPACVSGQIRLSGRKKADLAGLNKDTWTRIWARRYEPIFSIANGWRENARNYLATRVRESEAEEVQVDKAPSTGNFSGHEEEHKNSMKISDSCVQPKRQLRSASRTAAPEGNAASKELSFDSLKRPVLRVNR